MRIFGLLAVVGCAPATLAPITDGALPPADQAVDTDGDGWLDDEELELGSDPDWRFSWDFGGERWPDFRDEAKAAGLSGEGYAAGDVLPDFRAIDQFGNRVKLSTFYGYVIMLDLVGGWCGPCVDGAAEAEQMWEAHRLDGFMIVHVITDDETQDGVVEDDFPATWAKTHDLDFPVIVDADNDTLAGLAASGLYAGSIPFMVLLDTKMRIDSVYTGLDEVPQLEARALELLPKN